MASTPTVAALQNGRFFEINVDDLMQTVNQRQAVDLYRALGAALIRAGVIGQEPSGG